MQARSVCEQLSQIALGLLLLLLTSQAPCASLSETSASTDLWAHDNLFAWGAAVFDQNERGPKARAEMLERLGFKRVAFNWRENNIPTFDLEIEALKSHGIDLLAWALYVTDDAGVQQPWKDYPVESPGVLMGGREPAIQLSVQGLLETFKRHRVHPQLWLIQPLRPVTLPARAKEMSTAQLLQSADLMQSINAQSAEHWRQDLASTRTPQAQQLRVKREADRVAALVRLTEPYGVKVELYNHNGWFGMMDNQLAVIERLNALGVTDVGIVYNFDHARDALHDDTVDFPTLWSKIGPHVVAINVSGTHAEPSALYPSQGDRELEMMRTIRASGWKGPVGLNAEPGTDAEVTFKNCLVGLDWLAAELRQVGSAGPRPFQQAP